MMKKCCSIGCQTLAVVTLFLVAPTLMAAIGSSPRWLEEIAVGGGYGETSPGDGGADHEDDGTMES